MGSGRRCVPVRGRALRSLVGVRVLGIRLGGAWWAGSGRRWPRAREPATPSAAPPAASVFWAAPRLPLRARHRRARPRAAAAICGRASERARAWGCERACVRARAAAAPKAALQPGAARLRRLLPALAPAPAPAARGSLLLRARLPRPLPGPEDAGRVEGGRDAGPGGLHLGHPQL